MGISTENKLIFKRGCFFIETGTGKQFTTFLKKGSGIVKYISDFKIRQIENLININKRDQATVLWLKECEEANLRPLKIARKVVGYIVYITIR